MTRCFKISFVRHADEYEVLNANVGWYDKDECLVCDETELESDYEDTDALMVDLINMFNNFILENGFRDVTVVEIEEVDYDGNNA